MSPPNPTGSFAFTTTGTDQQGITGSGNAIASFLLGQVDTFQIDLQTAKIRPRDHLPGLFTELTGASQIGERSTLERGTAATIDQAQSGGRGLQPRYAAA